MFVQPSRLKAQGLAFSTVALLALGACDDPVALTDLRPEGAPEVLAVLVQNDPGLFFETATFCKANDNKRPGAVAAGLSFEVLQVCDRELGNPAGARVDNPDTEEIEDDFVAGIVTDTVLDGWYIRIMFDELLNPDVEDLVPVLDADGEETGFFRGTLENTQPVTVLCNGAEVEYDGYYTPSGNNQTWPLGPGLVVQPVDASTVASSSECTVTLKDVIVDKDNAQVPTDQRGGDDYKWQLQALGLDTTSPRGAADPAMAPEIAIDAPLSLIFNGFIDPASIDIATEVTIVKHATASCADATTTAVPATDIVVAGDFRAHQVDIGLSTAGAGNNWEPGSAYTVTVAAAAGAAAIADVAGGVGELDVSVCFLTEAAAP